MSGGRPAAFLDRDGVINHDTGYVSRPEDFTLLPGVPNALARLRGAGYLLILITNQSGIARGYFDIRELAEIHTHMQNLLADEGAAFDWIYFCPHLDKGDVAPFNVNCTCRKPLPGMIQQAIVDHSVDPTRSFMIGDKPTDVEAGRKAGLAASYRVGPAGECQDLADCADLILAGRS